MSSVLTGTLFDGETLAGQSVELTLTAGRLHSVGAGHLVDTPLLDITISDRLGDIPRFLYLPGGRTIVTPNNDAVDTLFQAQTRRRFTLLIHTLEQRYQVAAAATLLLVAVVVGTIWWALPVLARRAAMAVPDTIDDRAGQVSLAAIERVLAPSQLNASERNRVIRQAERLAKAAGLSQQPKLVFRSMGEGFPNAFALPGGYVIMSDELFRLADDDDEVASVLAHEIGHWQHRHGIQTVLRNSTALLVVSTVTGDLSTLTTFAGTIPFLLLQRGYSREFETEADIYALDLMRRTRIDPRHFRTILRKLDQTRPPHGTDFTYLSTHPNTEARISALGILPPDPPSVPAPSRKPDPTITPPHALFRPPPAYPIAMRSARIAGSVTIEFTVDVNGHTRDLKLVRSTHREFEQVRLAAIREWRFEPALKDGRPVPTLASQLLDFNPDDPIPLSAP